MQVYLSHENSISFHYTNHNQKKRKTDLFFRSVFHLGSLLLYKEEKIRYNRGYTNSRSGGENAMDELIKLYKKRLVKEAVIRSLLCALVVALAVLAVCSVIFWIVDYKHVWIGAVAFAVALCGFLPVFYFAKFRPSEKSLARRIDKDLGLDERMVTMLEYKGSNEVIACAQRANAVSVLRGCGVSGTKKIALKVFTAALAVTLSAAVLIGAGLTTVSALSAADVIPSMPELFRAQGAAKVFTISYTVEGVGTISGASSKGSENDTVTYFQYVINGGSAKAVWAVPGSDENTEYYFAGWSDGNGNPYRADKNITEDVHLVATFLPVSADEFEPEEDESDTLPIPPSGDNGNAPGEDSGPEDNEDKEDGDGNGAGGSSNPAFQVIDGKTDYGGSTYENARDEAEEELSSSDEIPDELKDIINGYMDIIKR